ncbi:MAG: hypothetical protein M0C28_11520 [Candidatus Moduliflexus flocculans]|nr:hypothetical protein [Candidatus Moduliflexus flocculans]
MKSQPEARTAMIGTATTSCVGGVALAVLGAGGIVAWEYSNSNAVLRQRCATRCTRRRRAPTARGAHARVNCVECHMGRLSTLHMMALKPTHAKELWGMIVGYERPLTSLDPAAVARQLRKLPLAVGRAPRQHRASRSATTPTPGEQRDHLPAGAAHRHGRDPREATPRASTGTSRTRSASSPPTRSGATIPWVQVKTRRRQARRPTSTPPASCPPAELKKHDGAADGVLRLPQRGRPPVPQSGRPGRRRDRRPAGSTAACRTPRRARWR